MLFLNLRTDAAQRAEIRWSMEGPARIELSCIIAISLAVIRICFAAAVTQLKDCFEQVAALKVWPITCAKMNLHFFQNIQGTVPHNEFNVGRQLESVSFGGEEAE
jgi:hypothetical protein